MDLTERKNDMRDFFDRKIDTYDEVHSQYMETKKLLSASLSGDERNILDLGAGTGLELIPLFKKIPDAHVAALDVSEKMLEELLKRPFADKLTAIPGDFFETDYGSDYDAVISTSALHHYFPEDKIKLYKKIYECLKPGGKFINSDKIVKNQAEEEESRTRYDTLRSYMAHCDTPLCPDTEIKLLEEAGFTVLPVQDTNEDDYKLFIAIK